ncbi:hypothetical protein ABZY09_35825 [Streptomyces sp. NPDC002928]|uniref:hypothetical protein n=1 Tax=Streptomyces sp. NPDC002928 TaxID=3154440 RepID=UPI0033B09D51
MPLLESGTNIVTTCTDLFARGMRLSDAHRAQLLQACEKGKSSIWPSGSDPGFITETVAFALLSVQRRIDRIEIEEFGDVSHRPSPDMVMKQMRFGKPLEEFDPDRRKNHLFGEYQPPLTVLAEAAGFEVDEWTATGGVAAARQDTAVYAGLIKAGTAAAQRTVRLRRHGRGTGLGPAAERLAPAHRGRRPVRGLHAPPGLPRRPLLVRPRLQRQRPGQRHPVRVRRTSRDPHHRGSPAHPPQRPARR